MTKAFHDPESHFTQKFLIRKKRVGIPLEPIEPETEDSRGFQSNKLQRDSIQYKNNVEELKNVRQRRKMKSQQPSNDQVEDANQIVQSKRKANHLKTRAKYSIIGTTPEPKSEVPGSYSSEGSDHKNSSDIAKKVSEKKSSEQEEIKKLQEIQKMNQNQIEELKKEKESELEQLKKTYDLQLQEMEKRLMGMFKEKQEVEIEQLKKKAEEEKEKLRKELEAAKGEQKALERKVELESRSEPTPPPAVVITQPLVPEVKKELALRLPNSQPESAKDQSNSRVERSQEEECLFAKILSAADHQYKLLVYGKRYASQRIELRMCMRCLDDPSIKIRDEVLDDENLQKILSGTALKDVVPLAIFAKGLTSLPEIIKYGVAPFAQIGQDGEDRSIEIWVHAVGIMKNSGLQVSFLGSTCHMGLHYVEKEKMRISLTLIDSDRGGSLYINLSYDKASFAKLFSKIATEEYRENQKEEWLPYFATINEDFLHDMDPALTEIESYLRRTHRGKFSFENVVKDNTLKLIEVAISYPNMKQVLWIIREKPKTAQFEIYCKGLFNVACNCL